MKVPLLLLAASLAGTASLCHGVVIYGGDGTGNTSAPGADNPWWNYAGSRGSRSAVYLGAYDSSVYGSAHWVITAAHVGAGTVTFGGISYAAVSGSEVRVKNPDNTDADLLLFRISSGPALPRLVLSASPPPLGASLKLMGNGWNRQPDLTEWDGSWGPPPPAVFSGYYWDFSGQALRWGDNQMEGIETVSDATWGMTQSITTDFDPVTGEAHAAARDSGGGVFYQNGSTWELAGVIGFVSPYVGQPASTAVVGNLTLAADISYYRDFILQTVPEPASWAVSGLLGLAALSWHRWSRRR